jgi:hypothetical protein
MNHERFKSMKYSGYQQLLTFRDSAFYLQGVLMGFLYSFFGYRVCLWICCILRFAYETFSCVSYILFLPTGCVNGSIIFCVLPTGCVYRFLLFYVLPTEYVYASVIFCVLPTGCVYWFLIF